MFLMDFVISFFGRPSFLINMLPMLHFHDCWNLFGTSPLDLFLHTFWEQLMRTWFAILSDFFGFVLLSFMLVLSLVVLACCLSSAASDSTLPPIVLLFDVVLFHCGFGLDAYFAARSSISFF